jgi:ribosomal protein S18 acetylase RimI-like enzyme
MDATPHVRPMRREDIPAVAALLRELAELFILHEFSPSARALFLSKNNEAAIAQFVEDGFRYHVAEVAGEIVGFVGVRDNSHLYHLFVARTLQDQGLGRRLWNIASSECRQCGNGGRFMVNSSNNAVVVYERFGFKRTAPMQDNDGVLFNPMKLLSDA